MTPDTAAIRARAEKATPGPWKFNDNGVVTADHAGKIVCCFVMDFARIPDAEDWEFLEHARADIPALCDEIDRLRAELAAKDDAVRAYINAMPAQIAQAKANAQDDLLTRIKKHIRHHFFAKQAIPLWRDISAEVDALRAAAQKEKAG